MSYQTFVVEELDNGQIIKVTLSRPKVLNAMNPKFFSEIGTIFRQINDKKQNARVVIFSAEGRAFSAGLDLKQYGPLFTFDPQTQQPARLGIFLYNQIRYMQKQFLTIRECRVPVIMCIHGLCIGGGFDLTCMGDIRYCAEDSKFTIKEIDIGMCADLGTMQILPNIIGNDSLFRQLAFTGRYMESKEALNVGFVSKVLKDKDQLLKAGLQTARMIASKSPVGIYTIKQIVKREQNKKIEEGLQYMARVNTSMLITKDMATAITAGLTKTKPQFPKL